MALAFGEMELLPDDFYRMSWREFFLLVRGRRKSQETDFITDAVLSREIAYQIYCSIPLRKGKRHVSKKKYWSLPWDSNKEEKEVASMKAAMELLKNKRNGTGD